MLCAHTLTKEDWQRWLEYNYIIINITIESRRIIVYNVILSSVCKV